MSQRIVLVYTNGQITQRLRVEADTPEEAVEKAARQASRPKPDDDREYLVWE